MSNAPTVLFQLDWIELCARLTATIRAAIADTCDQRSHGQVSMIRSGSRKLLCTRSVAVAVPVEVVRTGRLGRPGQRRPDDGPPPHYVVDPSSTRRRSSPPTDHQDSRSPSTAQAITPVAAGITANRIDDARGPDRLMHGA